MIAVDTNVLVYSHREDSPWHEAAKARVVELCRRALGLGDPLALPARVPGDRDPPAHLQDAHARRRGHRRGRALLSAPRLAVLAETQGYWTTLRRLLDAGRVAGPAVDDARIAALCLSHGASVLWSADRDFSRFPELVVRNPLLG